LTVSELQFINAFYGFCSGMANLWPNPLEGLGYGVIGVEREVTVSGQVSDRTVVPDVICASVRLHHVLCIDAKSRTVDGSQERAYMQMESSMLFAQGVVPTGISRDQLTHDNALATARSFCDALVSNMNSVAIELPVVVADETEFGLGLGILKQRELNDLLNKGIPVAGYEWPSKFVKFTSRSEDSDMAPVIVRSLMEYIRLGADFSADEVIARAIDHWHLVGQKERRDLRSRITIMLDEAGSEELATYFERLHPSQRWRVLWT
jgi:hypothetical protein